MCGEVVENCDVIDGVELSFDHAQQALKELSGEFAFVSSEYLPGPTGESNKLSTFSIGRVLCLGPTPELATAQALSAQQSGCQTLIICPAASGPNSVDGFLPRSMLSTLDGLAAVVCASSDHDLMRIRQSLAQREGALVPLIAEKNIAERCVLERHVCIDTTAAGGNVSLLASME